MADENLNLFEIAVREKWRFNSPIGELTTEQIMDLPLTDKRRGLDLDTIAKLIKRELDSSTEESFVSTAPNRKAKQLGQKLDLVKSVIADVIALQNAAKKRSERAALKATLVEALAVKQQNKILNMDEEDLIKKINELTDD